MIERIALAFVLAFAANAASAAGPATRMYKCVDAKGSTYYTQVPPPACLGRSSEVLSSQGQVVKKIKVLTPEQRAARAQQKKRRAEAEKRAIEEHRRDVALLYTYSSVKDIENARARALAQPEEMLKSGEKKVHAAKRRRTRLMHQKASYKRKPVPAKLRQEIQENALNIKQERSILNAKKREIAAINAKYDDDKHRYLKLTSRR